MTPRTSPDPSGLAHKAYYTCSWGGPDRTPCRVSPSTTHCPVVQAIIAAIPTLARWQTSTAASS
eukprot:2171517-Pleurochrysis_carterae.AAC.1